MSEQPKWRWLGYIVYAAAIATGFAAVPFWTRGLPLRWAQWAAIGIFPTVFVFLVVVMIREKP
jgi:hypothetical protein